MPPTAGHMYQCKKMSIGSTMLIYMSAMNSCCTQSLSRVALAYMVHNVMQQQAGVRCDSHFGIRPLCAKPGFMPSSCVTCSADKCQLWQVLKINREVTRSGT